MKIKVFRNILVSLLVIGCAFGGGFWFATQKFNQLEDPFGKLPGWVDSAVVNERFSIEFPKSPEVEIKQLDVPKAGQTIDYQEYHAEAKELRYSVSYVDFPGKWRLLGANTLLKKALELFVAHDKGSQELVSFEFIKHQDHPAINFVIKKGDQEIHGRLVLVGTTLYKLSVAYPTEMEAKESHVVFLDSFKPYPLRSAAGTLPSAAP
jgi:hypothetical protein